MGGAINDIGKAIVVESARAKSEEEYLQSSITDVNTSLSNEIERAKAAEKNLQDTKQDNLTGAEKQIKIENNIVGFADDAIWSCGDY